MKPIGIDLGNGAVKVRFGSTRLMIPNVIAIGGMQPEYGEIADPLDALNVIVDSSLVGDARHWYVGRLAATQGTMARYMLPTDHKTLSQQSAIVYLVGLAAAVVQHEVEANGSPRRELEADLYAVSGASLVESFQKGSRRRFEDKLRGEHWVTFQDPSPWAGVSVHLRVYPRVHLEGHTAYVWLMRNIPSIATTLSTKPLIGLAEVGELSTEFPVFRGVNIDPALSSGAQFGTASVMDELLLRIREFTQVPTAFVGGRMELERFLEQGRDTVSLMGRTYSLRPLIEEHLAAAAHSLYALIREKWQRVPNIEQFWVIGGGAALFHSYLQQKAQRDHVMLNFLNDLSESRWLNAEGMYLIAEQAMKREFPELMQHAQA
ncbi:ParM/StbA family protein [Alicyclobacillus macrosporangiidus]|nr:ParM/StbA family protein [Alicyclobacillus macrosporangiidus]